jgi:RNA polymerase sigma-70 factor (ECF subfamily)
MSKPFEILAAEYRPMILSYLRAVLDDGHLAEDLTQETFLVAQRKIESFDTSRNFGAWLRGIARNNVLQDRRTAARHPLVVDSDIVEGMEQVYDMFDDAPGPWQSRTRRVRDCIGQLNDSLRSAFVAVYGREESIREAAARMGISFAAVAKRLSRARELIRECVERSTQNPQDKRDEEPKHARSQ